MIVSFRSKALRLFWEEGDRALSRPSRQTATLCHDGQQELATDV
jgi:hypothetical protein